MGKETSTGPETPRESPQAITLPVSTTCDPPSPSTARIEVAHQWLLLWCGLPEGTHVQGSHWEGSVLHVTVAVPAPPVDYITLRLQL